MGVLISRLSKENRLFDNDDIRQKNKLNENNSVGDDLIIFWQNIMKLNEECIENINYNDWTKQYSFFYRDPVHSGLGPLRKIKVCKELKSANKPLLIELYVESERNDTNNY